MSQFINHAEQKTAGNLLPVDLTERLSALRARTAQNDQIWQPVEGETLAGIMLDAEAVQHPLYGQQWQLIIQDEQGQRWRIWLSQWLRGELQRQKADRSDLLAITYLGKGTNQRGTSYNRYSVAVDRGEVLP